MKPLPNVFGRNMMLLSLGLAISGCTPYPLDYHASESINTVTESAYPILPAPIAPLSSYPGAVSEATIVPSPGPYPTLAGGTPFESVLVSVWATPSPKEKVGLGSVQEVSPTLPVPVHYSVQGERRALYVEDTVTRVRQRLGDDTGVALASWQTASQASMDEHYLIWFFLCKPCSTFRSGIYAHSFRTGQDTWIDDKVFSTMSSVRFSSPWLTYTTRVSKYTASLRLYNLESGEKIIVAEDVFLGNWSIDSQTFSEVHQNKVAWLALDSAENGLHSSLKIYDISTKATTRLVVAIDGLSSYSQLRDLGVSNELVVWNKGAWWGYDLGREALFTIPVLPPGQTVETVQEIGRVLAEGDRLYWTAKIDGQLHGYTALVVAK